jgi:hypothetical protein
MNNAFSPPSRRGGRADQVMQRYRNEIGAARGGLIGNCKLDLPRRADIHKVALLH